MNCASAAPHVRPGTAPIRRIRWPRGIAVLLAVAFGAFCTLCAAAPRVVTLTLVRGFSAIEHVPPRVGDAIAFYVQVAGDTTGGVPVRMWVNGEAAAPVLIDAGNAGMTWNILSLRAGDNAVQADIAGDAVYAPSASNTLHVALDKGVPVFDPYGLPPHVFRTDFTTTQCIGGDGPALGLGQVPRPTGVLTVTVDHVVETVALTTPRNSSLICGSARFLGDSLPRGPLLMYVAYAGDANWQPRPGTAVLNVTDTPNVAIDIERSVATPVTGEPLQFTVRMVPLPGVSGVPDGSVDVFAPTRQSLPLDATATARFTQAFRSAGAGTRNVLGARYPARPLWYLNDVLPVQYLFPVDPASVALNVLPLPAAVAAGDPVEIRIRAEPLPPSVVPLSGKLLLYAGNTASYPPLCQMPVVGGIAACMITVTSPGLASFHATYEDGSAYLPASLGITIKVEPGSAPFAHLAAAPSALDLGATPIGETGARQTVVVTSTGAAAATVGVDVSAGFVALSDCPATLAANRQCRVDVAFAPQVEGAQAGMLTIVSNAAESPVRIALAGMGLPARAAPPAETPKVIEFHHAAFDHYFITSSAMEIDALDSGRQTGWTRTGQSFGALAPDAVGARPVCRFYGRPERGLDSHFYSADGAECADVALRFAADWLLETSDAFRIVAPEPATGTCPAGTIAVYRLFNNRRDANHRYTTDSAIRDAMIARGYALEGNGPGSATMCAAP